MNQAFIKHFALTENDIKQAEAQLAQGFTLLECLFEKNLIDHKAYISWAKDHFGLPVLKPDFLEKNNSVETLLTRYPNVFPRCVIPFHEWDGVLYVMCLEPVTFKAPQTIQYILAPYEIIKKYSAKIESKAQEIMHVDFPVEKTEVTNPLFKTLGTEEQKSEQKPLLNFDDIKLEKLELSSEGQEVLSAEEKPESSEENNESLAGLNFPEFKPEKPNYVIDTPVVADELRGLDFGKISVPTATKTTTQSAQVTKAPPIAAAPATPAAITPAEAVPTQKTNTMPMPTAQPTTPPQAITAKPVIPAVPFAPVASIPAKPQAISQTPTAAPIPTPVTPMPVSTIPTQKVEQPTAYKNICDLMKKYFQQTMVLAFQNGVLSPISWDETWTKLAHAQSAIDTNTASIFRIVKETLKPFHGYVIQNPINNSFFQTWNNGKLPEHITICPIFEGGTLYGMVLGITNKDGAKKYQLHHIEEIAKSSLPLLKQKKAA